MRDEDGVMSLDFLAGFTIFLLALIMVVSMVPGLLAGLGSSSIDYDAVAYRTGVILAEDPGWPAYPPWEMAGNPDEIERMGLAVSKETPNILLSTKVDRFFDGAFAPDDYRSKAIFGDIPYSYNFSLNISHPWGYEVEQTGDPLPPGHGYIRRVVKIKEPGAAVIDGSLAPRYLIPVAERQNTTTREFTVRLDLRELLDPSIGPAYRIDPRTEPVSVTIRDFDAYLNGTASDATLTSVRFWKMDTARPNPRFTLIPFSYEAMDPNIYTLRIDGEGCNLTPNRPVTSSISFVLKPEAISRFTLDQNSILDIRFTFDNKTNIGGTYLYNYENATPPPLKPAVLEVAIW